MPEILAQAVAHHQQEAARIAAELPVLQEVVQAPPSQLGTLQEALNDFSAAQQAAAGIPAPERPAPAQPATFLEASERWDDEDQEPDPFSDLPQPSTTTENEMNEEYQGVPSGFPNPEPGELIMTRAQLGRSRKPDIKNKSMRVISMKATEPPVPGWWAGFGLGYAEDKAHAAVFTYGQIMDLSSSMVDTYMYVEYDKKPVAAEAVPAKNEPVRKCSWVTVLGQQLVEMIRIAPKNNTFRARVMALLKESPPDDCVTAQQIQDWVEFNFPKDPKAQDTSLDLNFRMNYNHIEVGTCRYRRRVNGAYTGKLTKTELVNIVRNNPDTDFDELMAIIRQHCEDIARHDGHAHFERVEEWEHQPTDFTDHDSDMLTSLRGPVTSILREALEDHEIDDLGI